LSGRSISSAEVKEIAVLGFHVVWALFPRRKAHEFPLVKHSNMLGNRVVLNLFFELLLSIFIVVHGLMNNFYNRKV